MYPKALEKNILNKVDELIEILISLSKKEGDQERLFEKCYEKTEEIVPLVFHLIDGNNSLLVPMLYQLIMEKLPDARIISSFGSLQEEVNRLLSKIKEKYDNTDYNSNVQTTNNENRKSVNNTTEKGLYFEVSKAFPGFDIFPDYRICGEIVDVFIPDLKLVLIKDINKHSSVLKFYCQDHNLQLIQIPKEFFNDYRKILRFIRQKRIN